MSSKSRWIQCLAALVVLAVAACSQSASMSTTDGTTPSATVGGTTPSTSTGGTATTSPKGDTGLGEAGTGHDSFIIQCLAEQGIHAQTLADRFQDSDLAGKGVFIPDSYQREAVQRALEDCRQAAIDAGLQRDFEDPVVLREVYWERVDLYDCLVAHSFPATPPPSEESFVESKGGWHPGDAMATSLDTTMIEEAAEACPSEGFGVIDLRSFNSGE